jgi:hypothetical protein
MLVQKLAGDGSTVVEHLPYHPKVEGLSPAADAGTGREEMAKTHVLVFIQNKYCHLTIILLVGLLF